MPARRRGPARSLTARCSPGSTRAHERAVAAVATLTGQECRPGPGPVDKPGIDPDHPWARLTSNERMVSKADSCTYRLYDALLEQQP